MHTFIEKIAINNFRNIINENISFKKNINCIFGNNGNGKTNILEAIYFLLNKRSFRKNSSFPQFLNYDVDESNFSIQLLFTLEHEQHSFSCRYNSIKESIYSFDGKLSKFKSHLTTILINPFDAYEFFNTPKKRRDWFDEHLSKLDKNYSSILKRYQKGLRHKNILLQQQQTAENRKQVIAINVELAKNIKILTKKRIEFLNDLKKYYYDTFKSIFDIDCELEIKLEPSIPLNYLENIEDFLNNAIEKEFIVGKSLYGSHKDNYHLFFNGLNAIDYCSIGQQKMSYFSLIFAYIKLFRYKCNTFPIILMDDISGELDENRWDKLISYLDSLNLQVIITTANKKFKEKLQNLEQVNLLNIANGTVTTLKEKS